MYRLMIGFGGQFLSKIRMKRVAIVLRPSTLFRIHEAFVKRKYSRLFLAKTKRKPGPRGPTTKLIELNLEFKPNNPRCGYRRIAEQLSDTFKIELDKDVVRRVLEKHMEATMAHRG
jgi:putative transposase